MLPLSTAFFYAQPFDAWWGQESFRHATYTDASSWPEPFQPYEQLEGLPNTTNISITPLSNATLEMALATPEGDRNVFGTFTYHPSIELEQKILDLFLAEVNSVKTITGFLPATSIQAISRTAIENMKKRGGNTLGIAESAEQAPLTVLITSWKWTLPTDDERIYAAFHRFLEQAETAAQEMGRWHPYKYINYAAATQDVWTGLGEENLRELRRVQREVGPDGVFTKGGLGGGYFKLNDLRR